MMMMIAIRLGGRLTARRTLLARISGTVVIVVVGVVVVVGVT